MDGGGTLTGVRDAARVLGVNPSTISRQLDKFVAAGLVAVEEREGKKLFSLEDYRRAAAQATNPLMARQGGAAIQMGLAAPPAGYAPQAPAPPVAPLATASTAYKALQAKRLAMDIERDAERLVSRAAIDTKLQIAGRELRDTLLALPARLKGELASMTDPAEIQRTLEKAIKDSLAQVAAAFARLRTNDTLEPETPQS